MSIFKRSRRAAVLGCGPAGLFAAHALVEAGWDVDVFSNKRRSEMFGAQYLHEPIHGLEERSTELTYMLRGSAEEYRLKVYGSKEVGSVSPESLTGQHKVWDIRAAYYDAWDQYANLIRHRPGMGVKAIEELVGVGAYRFILSSLPAPSICYKDHQFKNQRVWAVGDAPERGVFCPVVLATKDTVVCDGRKEVGWYRASNVFGYNSCEWPEDRKPPVSDVSLILKPISTNCDCWSNAPTKLVRIGRYGTWTKGVLSHEAYKTAKELAR